MATATTTTKTTDTTTTLTMMRTNNSRISNLNNPDHSTLGKCSKIQMAFIKSVKAKMKTLSKGAIPFIFEAPAIMEVGHKTKVEHY
jgi:hypothetical protein